MSTPWKRESILFSAPRVVEARAEAPRPPSTRRCHSRRVSLSVMRRSRYSGFGRASTPEALSPSPKPGGRAVNAVGELLVRELVLVVEGALQPPQLDLERSRQVLLARLAVQVVELGGVVHEIEQLPLVLPPEVDQLVRPGAHTVVRARVVVARIVVVAVVHRRAPVRRRAAPQHADEAPPLHVAGQDRKSTRLNSSHVSISYAVFCLK